MNRITEGKGRENLPDRHGEVSTVPTSAAIDLAVEVSEASEFKATGRREYQLWRSSIESRTDLRIAATNEAMKADPTRSGSDIEITKQTAERWADLDAADFGRIRAHSRRENALEAIAGHMRTSPQYADEMKKRSPALADSANELNLARKKIEKDLAAKAAEEQQRTELAARASVRQSTLDAAGMAALATVRARETARVVDQLASSPDASTQQLRDAVQSLKASPLDGRVTAPNDPDMAAMAHRAIKRPVADEELSRELLKRYIVSHEKRGLMDKGSTEFTYRSGDLQGQLAFVDSGKSLDTQREDKSTIRAMVEVATAKNWREITVNGTDDFKRNAWLEASLNNLKVRGYEPHEADKMLLAEQQARHAPSNSIEVVQQVLKRDTAVPENHAARARKHIDGDALSPEEKKVLDTSRAFLTSKDMGFGPGVTDATIRELESRLRGERLFVGQIVDHGHAPYRHDKNNDPSYFVVLKSPAGEQVVWGKGLAEAMRDQKNGNEIVLQNTGKKDVVVDERVRDAAGNVIDVRQKASQLNAWKAEPLSQYSERGRADLLPERTAPKNPTFKVYDANAERAPLPPPPKNPILDRAVVRGDQPPVGRIDRDR